MVQQACCGHDCGPQPLCPCTTDQQVCIYQHSNGGHPSRLSSGTTQILPRTIPLGSPQQEPLNLEKIHTMWANKNLLLCITWSSVVSHSITCFLRPALKRIVVLDHSRTFALVNINTLFYFSLTWFHGGV